VTASYPTIVRKFTPRVDGTEFVMAADVNGAYDEITAVESTLGANPQVYHPASGAPVSYSTVGSRLDQVQQNLDTQTNRINILSNDAKTGWQLPVASIAATGTQIAPTGNYENVLPSDWHALRWNAVAVDTNGVYAPGNTLTIPWAGWWIITVTCGMVDPGGADEQLHTMFARIRANSSNPGTQTVGYVDFGQGDSTSGGETGGWHRITMATGAVFGVGDTLQVHIRHVFVPGDEGAVLTPQTLTASARIQLTYIRGLPAGSSWGGVQLPYEIGT
jgi:hypothetical protein